MRKICRALVLCMLLLTAAGAAIAAADKGRAGTGTYCIIQDSRSSSGGSR